MDSTDVERVGEARDELQKLLAEPELEHAKLLVFANKQDVQLPHTMRVSEVTDQLGLSHLRQRDWYVQGCSGTTGEGLHEGLDWLASSLRNA